MSNYRLGMGRRSDARDKLITAATEVLWRFGYHGATVDRICEAAQVRRGSFHYFFGGKDGLVLAAIEAAWQERQVLLDEIFSPRKEPLQRLESYFAAISKRQTSLKKQHGRVLGCFFTSLGSQLDGADPEIGRRVQQALSTYERYYVAAVCEAAAKRQLELTDPEERGRDVFAFVLGVLAQARVNDDLRRVRALGPAALAMLGADLRVEARAS